MISIQIFVSIAALITVAHSQSLNVANKCSYDVFLFTQTSFGTIANNLVVAAGATQDMGISSDWDGAINVGMYHLLPDISFDFLNPCLGTGCNSDGTQCTTGGPTWNGVTPFSRGEFNFVSDDEFLFSDLTCYSQYHFVSTLYQDL